MKTIELFKNDLGRYDDVSAFPVGDLALTLNGIPSMQADFRFVANVNNKVVLTKSVDLYNNKVTIPQDKLEEGTLSCFVSCYVKGVEIKRYNVEDLLITAVDGKVQAQPRLGALELALADLGKKARKYMLFAAHYEWEDYQNNLYMDCKSFSDFVERFLPDEELTAQEIEFIKHGGTKNA